MQATNDGYMDRVHTLREQYGADLVALLTGRTDTGGYAGVGYLMTSVSSLFNTWAFSVTRQDYATRHTFIHEIGHNLGCHHDFDNASGSGAYAYSLGHRFYGNSVEYRTVMAYAPGTRISYFSSPGINYGGTSTGIANQRDNARSIFNVMETVGAFRAAVYGDVNLKAIALDDRVMLRWTQPTTVGYGSDRVHLRYSTSAYPATTDDGLFAYEGINQSFLHTNITSGVTHLYTIWPSDDASTFIEP